MENRPPFTTLWIHLVQNSAGSLELCLPAPWKVRGSSRWKRTAKQSKCKCHRFSRDLWKYAIFYCKNVQIYISVNMQIYNCRNMQVSKWANAEVSHYVWLLPLLKYKYSVTLREHCYCYKYTNTVTRTQLLLQFNAGHWNGNGREAIDETEKIHSAQFT